MGVSVTVPANQKCHPYMNNYYTLLQQTRVVWHHHIVYWHRRRRCEGAADVLVVRIGVARGVARGGTVARVRNSHLQRGCSVVRGSAPS